MSAFSDCGGVFGGGVEVGFVACSGQCDVAGFAEHAGGADDEHVVAGESLGFVERRRVAVVDVIGFDVSSCET